MNSLDIWKLPLVTNESYEDWIKRLHREIAQEKMEMERREQILWDMSGNRKDSYYDAVEAIEDGEIRD